MEAVIERTLRGIEEREHVRILYAAEAGSRAWGFASPDSDYDVRFVYVRPVEEYLRLDRERDVIELPIDEVLDVSGWDLDKCLRLLYRSNPTLYEWFGSPVVYRESALAPAFGEAMEAFFSPNRSLYHYVSTAERNYKAFLTGELVRPKKYFYVLRPVLACTWILEHKGPAPVPFQTLLETQLSPQRRAEVEKLLQLKREAPEQTQIAPIPELNAWLKDSIREIRQRMTELPEEHNPGWEPLNRLFRAEIERVTW